MGDSYETEDAKRKAEEDLMSARFWLKEASQFGGDLSRFKRAVNRAKRAASEVGVDVEAVMKRKVKL